MKFDYALYTINQRSGVDLLLNECGWQRCYPRHSYGPLVRSAYMLHFLVGGEGTYTVNNTSYPLKAGDLFLIAPSTTHYYYANPDNPYEYYWVSFIGAETKRLLDMVGISIDNPVLHFQEIDTIKDIYQQLLAAAKQYSDTSALDALGQLYRLFALLSSYNEKNTKQDNSYPYISEAIKYIHDNFMNHIAVTDIARHVSLHRSYLTSLFIKQLHMSPMEYLLSYRFTIACKLMRTTNMTIQEIGLAVGFPDHTNFSTRFKKYKGVNPSTYRKSNYDRDTDPLEM